VRSAALLTVFIIFLTACNGGTVDLHALKQDSDAIDSLACEGALLASEVANRASTSSFTKVHAGELATRASNFEDALSSRPTTPGIERAVRSEARKAGRIAGLLDQLEAQPSDSEGASRLKALLKKQGGCS
jgi:hypothetical protein